MIKNSQQIRNTGEFSHPDKEYPQKTLQQTSYLMARK